MIARLLRKNISRAQLAAYVTACTVGLAILLASAGFYADIRSARDSRDGAPDYIVLSKPVNILAALGSTSPDANAFTESEIAELEKQPWVKRVGRFTAADFNISASVNFAGHGLSTALFFESVPDEFVDIPADEWTYKEGDGTIPIAVPRDYLALYNYGFAAARGMPQLSENLIRQIPLRIAMSGDGKYDVKEGRIVGLSDRLNTIAVPESFMDEANKLYGGGDVSAPSRLMVEVTTPGDPAIDRWLEENDIESSADATTSARTVYLAGIAATVVGVIGIVIAALAVMILLLSLYLLVQKNSEKIRDLILLGYKRSEVAAFYYRLVVRLNVAITVAAFVLGAAASRMWNSALADFNLAGERSLWIMGLIALGIMAAVTLLSILSISRLIKKASR